MKNSSEKDQNKDETEECKKAILTIGDSHYVIPIKNYYTSINIPKGVSLILEENTIVELSTNNVILITGESELIKALLESESENFYQPETNKYGKIKMKKITIEGTSNRYNETK